MFITKKLASINIDKIEIDTLKQLINRGADVNATDNQGNTALMRASQNKDNLVKAQTLLALKADATLVNKSGETALSIAIKNSNYDLIPALLQKEGLKNYPAGRSPFIDSIESENALGLVYNLARYGANPNIANAKGEQILDLIKDENMWEILTYFGATKSKDPNEVPLYKDLYQHNKGR